MQFIKGKEFSGTRAWDALDIAEIDGATVRLHWTDKPYIWHTNDGAEVFALLDGAVDMHYRRDGQEIVVHMSAGDIFYADVGDEHVAHPTVPSRILVIEKKGSI